MLWRKFIFCMFFAGLTPFGVLASVVYTPSQSCGANVKCSGDCYSYARRADCQPAMMQYREWHPGASGGSVVRSETMVVKELYEPVVRSAPMARRTRQTSVNTVSRDWYVGINAMMNLWSWENEYGSDKPGVVLLSNSDDYSFEPVFGGALVVGTYFQSGLRGDIELGMSSEFSDADDFATYKLSVPYLMANVYYDFESGMYLGGGLGVARPEVTLSGASFIGGGSKETSISPKVGFGVGYATEIADNVFIDFRYRLSLMKGTDIIRSFEWEATPGSGLGQYVLQVENDLILENALSVGIRFNF